MFKKNPDSHPVAKMVNARQKLTGTRSKSTFIFYWLDVQSNRGGTH